MGRMFKAAWTASCQGFAEVLLYFPVLVIIQAFLLHGSRWSPLLLLLFLGLGYGIGSYASSQLRLNRFYRLLLFCILGSAALSYVFYGADVISFVAGALLIGIALYRGAGSELAAWRDRFPFSAYLTGLLLYFFSSVIFNFVQALQPYTSLLLWCGIGALVITLYVSNSQMLLLETAGGEDSAVPAGVRRHNRLQVGLLLAAVLLLAFLQRLDQVLMWLRDWIRTLLGNSGKPEPELITTPEQTLFEPMFPEEQKEPSALLMLMEKLLTTLIFAGLVLLFIWLLYQGLKRVPGFAAIIRRWLSRLLNQQSGSFAHDGYVDEVETVLDWNGRKRDKERRNSGKQGRERWQESMDAKDKVRFLYRSWLRQKRKQGYEPLLHHTPRETLHDLQKTGKDEQGVIHPLTDLYERARYGKDEIKSEEIMRIKEKMKE